MNILLLIQLCSGPDAYLGISVVTDQECLLFQGPSGFPAWSLAEDSSRSVLHLHFIDPGNVSNPHWMGNSIVHLITL